MTALAVAPPDVARPIPWLRLSWVVWRRYRPVLVGLAVVLIPLAIYLVISGDHLRSAYNAVAACKPPAHSSSCEFRWQTFTDTHGDHGFLSPILLLLPGLVGAFVGAPLLGRELETGAFRYAWTQGVGRMRLAVALIVPAAIGVTAVMVALGVLETWADKPLVDSGIRQRLEGSVFPTTGPAVAGWTLIAFAGGVLAGMLWRRVVPALASCFVVWFGLAYVGSRVRLHYLSPLTTSHDLGPHDMEIDSWWTKGGVRASDAQINSALQAIGVQINGNGIKAHVVPGGSAPPDPMQYLTQHGYTQVTSYQPGSRYWTFQWIELGWLTLLAVAMLGIAFWLLRRHSA